MAIDKLHRHHIIPKHMGGSNHPSNLTPPISIERHALYHKELWEVFRHPQDYIAWMTLAGRNTTEEARLAAAKIGQENSQKYKNSRKDGGFHLARGRTKETCAAGGRSASLKLVAWQKENVVAFKQRCAELGRLNAVKRHIAHIYKDTLYFSKKDLQEDTGLSNTGFYSKLKRGDIIRLSK